MARGVLSHLTNLDPTGLGGEKGEKEKEREKGRDFRKRGSTFSLNFSVIGPSNSGETRGKVGPHCKSYAWVSLLWSFDKLREVGVFSTWIFLV